MKNSLLNKFFSNNLNEDENIALRILENKMIFDNKDEIFKNEFQEEKIKNEILLGVNSHKESIFSWQNFIKIAAAIVIMFGIGIGYNSYSSKSNLTEFSNNLNIPQSHTLPDGSKITLASGGYISYGNDFNKDLRSIELKGEAFFEVAHDKTRPFRIITNHLNTEVIGTSFNIKQTENNVKVTVVTGLVKVYDSKHEVKVKPHHEVIYDTGNGDLVKKEIENDYATSWMKDKYRLKKVTVEQLVEFIEIRYDIHLIYSDSEIGEKRFTTTVRKGESLDDFINKVNNLEEFVITKTDDKLLQITLVNK